jgi:hypothetical protein
MDWKALEDIVQVTTQFRTKKYVKSPEALVYSIAN